MPATNSYELDAPGMCSALFVWVLYVCAALLYRLVTRLRALSGSPAASDSKRAGVLIDGGRDERPICAHVDAWESAMSSEVLDSDAEALAVETEPTAAELEDERLRQEELEAKRQREALEERRRTLGDAEETCIFLLNDLVDALFQEMQVRSENVLLFMRASQQACAQVFEGVAMSAFKPPEPLDRGQEPVETRRQQVLRPRGAQTLPLCRTGESRGVLTLLRRLLRVLETKRVLVEHQLLCFPTSQAVWTSSGRRKSDPSAAASDSARASSGSADWGLPSEDVAEFLHQLLAAGLVNTLPSAVAFLLAANSEALDKKQQTQTRVTLTQLQLLAQKAVLSAEGDENPVMLADSNLDASGDDYQSTIFQTEVPPSEVTQASQTLDAVELPRLLSCYQEEAPPVASAVDRRVPSQVARKPELSAANPATRLRSRKIMMLLAPAPKPSSRWMALRTRMAVTPREDGAKPSGVSAIAVSADMELLVSGGEKKLAAESPNELEDAATLSNIFALGTPRQLSATELSRRQDLLAQLEREQLRAVRRQATLTLAAMSWSCGTTAADERLFQEYVAANSTITTGLEADGPSAATVGLSPTRPDPQAPGKTGGHARGRGRGRGSYSKFELEREPLGFAVSDGNAHRRFELLDAALCSPIKRPMRLLSPSPPETPGRPVQTASTAAHLPQLESSRLAVGVSAVVRGVQKRGPRRHPSRKSRLQLHNYSAAFEGLDELEDTPEEARLPLLPTVSPIKASPHRKHVMFSLTGRGDSPEVKPPTQARRRPAARASQQQSGWESRTRNRHFASGRRFRKVQRLGEDAVDATRAPEKAVAASRPPPPQQLQPPTAPRKDVLPRAAYLTGD